MTGGAKGLPDGPAGSQVLGPHLSVQDTPEASSPRGPVAALPQQPYGHGFGGTESLVPPAKGPEGMGTRTWSPLSHG